MNHNELFFGFPSGIENIRGQKTFEKVIIQGYGNQGQRIDQFRVGFDSTHFAYFNYGPTGTFNIGSINGAASGDLNLNAANLTISGLATFSSIATFSSGLISSSGTRNLFIPSAADVGASTNAAAYIFAGAANIQLRVGFRGTTSTALTANVGYANVVIGQAAVTEATTGTHPMLAQLVIKGLDVTAGAATVTDSASLYIEDAGNGTVSGANYALWVDAGINRFDGNTCIGTLAAPSTTAFLFLGAGTTAKASLNIAVASAPPSSPQDGDIWREDNTNTGLKYRVNGVTKTITLT